MRARFSVETTLSQEEMYSVFNELHWIPNLKDDNTLEEKRAENFIQDLPVDNDTQELVRATFCFLIFDYSTSVWGVVNQPTSNIYTIRLGHENIEILRNTAHQQLEKLLQARSDKIKTADNGNVSFFERDESKETMSAKYKTSQNFSMLLKNRRQALWSAIITFFFGTIATYLSHPAVWAAEKLVFTGNSSGDVLFWEQFLGRIATAFFVGSILAIYDIAYHIRTQRNSSATTLQNEGAGV